MDAMRKTSEIKCSPAEAFISTKMKKAVSKDIQTVILQCCNTQTFTLKDQKPKRFFTNSFINKSENQQEILTRSIKARKKLLKLKKQMAFVDLKLRN